MGNTIFSIKAGILQGDPCGPFLFITVFDYVLLVSVDTIANKEIELKPRRSSTYPAEYLTDIYLLGIALISQSLVTAQSLLQSLEQASNCVGLYFYETKTEFVNICTSDSDFMIKTLNTLLKMVPDYGYLGSRISFSGKDFLSMHGMA